MENYLKEEILNNPWSIAYECSRRKCSVNEIVEVLSEFLSKPMNSGEYKAGLEFIKVLKSQAPRDVMSEVIEGIKNRGLVDKLLKDTDPDIVISTFRKDYSMALGLLTILELYPFIGLEERLVDYSTKIIVKAPKVFGRHSPQMLRELMRSLIYGPLTVLRPVDLDKMVDTIRSLPNEPLYLQLKADLLLMIVESYPQGLFLDNIKLITCLAELVRDLAKGIVSLLSGDPEMAMDVYSELNTFISKMNRICVELSTTDPCKLLISIAGKDLEEAYNRIGKLILEHTT